MPLRSQVIEASGSSEAWYVPPRPFTCCGLADSLFEQFADSVLSCRIVECETYLSFSVCCGPVGRGFDEPGVFNLAQ